MLDFLRVQCGAAGYYCDPLVVCFVSHGLVMKGYVMEAVKVLEGGVCVGGVCL